MFTYHVPPYLTIGVVSLALISPCSGSENAKTATVSEYLCLQIVLLTYFPLTADGYWRV
jgi:hypothetical protein